MKKMISILLAVITIMSIVLTVIPMPAFAATVGPTTGSTFEADLADASRGTATNPIRITTIADYQAFFKTIAKNSTYDYTGKVVQLQNDIVFNDTSVADWYENPTNKLSVDGDTSNYWGTRGFSGTFDGNGKTLKGVYMYDTHSQFKDAGLFPAAKDAVLKNFTVDGFYIKNKLLKSTNWGAGNGFYAAGALVGYAFGGIEIDGVTVKNGIVTNDSNVDGTANAKTSHLGGLIGVVADFTENPNRDHAVETVITNTKLENVSIYAGSGTTSKRGGILGAFYFKQGDHIADGTSYFDLTGSKLLPNDVDNMNAIGDFTGVGGDWRKDPFAVYGNDYEKQIDFSAGGNAGYATLNAVNAAILECGAYDPAPTVIKFLGAQRRTDGKDGIRFLAAVSDIDSFEKLGFKISVDKSDGRGNTDIAVDKTLVTKVYTEVPNATMPSDCKYIYTFAILGSIPSATTFTVSTYAKYEDGTEEIGLKYPITYGDLGNTLTIYPEFDTRIERDYMYSVSVSQGYKTASIPVYNHTTDDYVIRNNNDKVANEYRRFSTFAFGEGGGQVRVDIKVNTDFSTYSVLPSVKNFKTTYADGVISVYLDKPEYFNIRLDGKDSTMLSVLVDKPEEAPTVDSNTIVVDGWYKTTGGVLTLNKANQTVYIKPGAVLNARIKVNANNCKIIGRGIVLDPASNMYNEYDDSALSASRVIEVNNADNTVIDGIHMLNAYGFNISVQGVWGSSWSDNTSVTNVKILSTQLCSDGILFGYYSKGSVADNCFVYCGDNALVAEEDATYKNITLGTTCNALYPQTHVVNTLFENIYVFRADEGIIDHTMNEGSVTRVDYTVRNLYANDVTFVPYIIRVDNAGYVFGSENGGLKIENLYLPKASNTSTTNFYNNINTTSGSVYEITMKNVSVNGTAVSSISSSTVGAAVKNGTHPAIVYTKDASFNGAVPTSTVNVSAAYTEPIKVFIGTQQVYLNSVIKEGSVYKLPYAALKAELYTTATAPTETINGIEYVSSENLVSSGMAASISTSGGKLVITPKTYSGNLIANNGSEVPDFLEIQPQNTYINVTDGVYTLTDKTYSVSGATKAYGSGMASMIDDELRKLGAGTYRLTFSAKSAGVAGNISTTYGTYSHTTPSNYANQTHSIGTSWTAVEFTFSVTSAQMTNNSALLLSILIPNGSTLLKLDMKDISLVKIS